MENITIKIMRLLYNFAISFYGFLIFLASISSQKAKLWLKGRKNWSSKLSEKLKMNSKPVIWIHCSSLGEFEQGRPVIEELVKQNINAFILLTFFSPSGYEIQKNYSYADFVCYLPLDTQRNAKLFVSIVKPKVAIFVKYEFWFNYLLHLKKAGTKTWLISAIFRENQHFFKVYGKWFVKQLSNFEHFFVQNDLSAKLLQSICYGNVTVGGDTRFDRVLQITAQIKPIETVENFKKSKQVIIAGSTWSPDEDILIDYINNSIRDIKYIIAPHEIDSKHIETILSKITKKTVLYSNIEKIDDLPSFQVLIINNIGMLSTLYQYGTVAMIGGGFGKGIHNILEPAVFGLPIIIGTNYSKFNEAVELTSLGTVFPVKDKEGFKNQIDNLFDNSEKLLKIKQVQKEYTEKMSGSTEIIVGNIIKIPTFAPSNK